MITDEGQEIKKNTEVELGTRKWDKKLNPQDQENKLHWSILQFIYSTAVCDGVHVSDQYSGELEC